MHVDLSYQILFNPEMVTILKFFFLVCRSDREISNLVLYSYIFVANLDLLGTKNVFKYDSNPWAPPIVEQLNIGLSHLFEYVKSDTYK